MAQRLTRKTAEILCTRLNEILGLPTECYLQDEDGRYKAQIGCIHLYGVNGGYNVCQLSNSSGGVRVLAHGLSARESCEWLTAALEGVRLARIPVTQTLDTIASILSANEWTPDTVSAIADLIRDTGRTVEDVC